MHKTVAAIQRAATAHPQHITWLSAKYSIIAACYAMGLWAIINGTSPSGPPLHVSLSAWLVVGTLGMLWLAWAAMRDLAQCRTATWLANRGTPLAAIEESTQVLAFSPLLRFLHWMQYTHDSKACGLIARAGHLSFTERRALALLTLQFCAHTKCDWHGWAYKAGVHPNIMLLLALADCLRARPLKLHHMQELRRQRQTSP